MQRRNVEVSLSYRVIVVNTWGAHVLLLVHRHSENILVDLVDSQIWMRKASMTDMEPPENGSILTSETTQITVAKERFDRV